MRAVKASAPPLRHLFVCAGAVLALTVGTLDFGRARATAPGAARLDAVYRVNFAGINLGDINFVTNMSASTYAVKGAGKLEFLSGALWQVSGGTASSGAITNGGPRPASFSYHFENGSKHGKLDMSFKNDEVREIVSDIPDLSDQPRYVPLSRGDLIGVLDPVSAFFLSAKASGKEVDPTVCDQRVPVFDGKHRFDLQLSLKQVVRVKSKTPGGYNGMAVICHVKYIPISGYKTTEQGVQFLASTNDIEVWLIPLPIAGVYVPYHVSVPTPFGPATVTSARMRVQLDNKTQTVIAN